MMKRLGIVFSLSLLTVLLAAAFCTASALELETTYPENGYKNAAIDNFGIKLYFDQDVISEENETANAKCITVKDETGKVVPTIVLYSEKEEGLVMVLADMTDKNLVIEQDREYTVNISGDFMAANGETLGEDVEIAIKTLNQSQATKVNMIMMVVMCVGMVVISTRSSKKKREEEENFKKEEEKVNPYKVAKETGKSVEEVVEQERKKKEKQAAAAAKKAKKEAETERILAEAEKKKTDRSDVKRVKRARAVKAEENAYVAKRQKEAAVKAAAARAKRTTHPKKSGGKKRK